VPAEDPDEVISRIGRKIAEIRREKGLTQRKLAEHLGVAVTWVSQIETKGSNLEVRTIVKIAGALGVEARELWEPPEADTSP
jgi:transcriptional regulator with XRE-family HTH domain